MHQLQANRLYKNLTAAAILIGQSSCSYSLAGEVNEQQSRLDLNNTNGIHTRYLLKTTGDMSIYQITKGFPYKEKIFAWV